MILYSSEGDCGQYPCSGLSLMVWPFLSVLYAGLAFLEGAVCILTMSEKGVSEFSGITVQRL